jgi:hypothetical protein
MARRKKLEEPVRSAKSDGDEAHDGHDPALVREVRELARNSAGVLYSRVEVAEQLELVSDLLMQGTDVTRVWRICRARWSTLSKKRVDRLVERVRERWMADAEKTKGMDREAAIRRIHNLRAWAAGEKDRSGANWVRKPDSRTLLHCERLLMDLQGTREAIKVDVTATYTQAMLTVMARLEGDEASAILEEAHEQERLAEAAKRHLPAVLTVNAEE